MTKGPSVERILGRIEGDLFFFVERRILHTMHEQEIYKRVGLVCVFPFFNKTHPFSILSLCLSLSSWLDERSHPVIPLPHEKKINVLAPGLEPGIFRVLGGRVNQLRHANDSRVNRCPLERSLL